MIIFREKEDNKDNLTNVIKLAHKEWKEKEMLLDEVTDPDLIDFAIYEVEASKIKYTYLLKKYKKELKDKDTSMSEDEKVASY